MVLGPSLGAFLGSAFLAFLCAYILLNLARDKEVKRSPDGTEEVVSHNVKHKFLQLILWGVILLALLINGAAVADMSSQTCDWVVTNETVSGNTTTYSHSQVCEVEENTQALLYQRLIYALGIPLIGFYIVINFILMGFRKVAEMRREDRRRQGR